MSLHNMTTEFVILSAATVPENYIWDNGIPLTGINIETIPITTFTTSVTGRTPGVKVIFKNNSTVDAGYTYRQFFWDFGDYYNLETNFLGLTCTTDVEHTYLMPGEYTVTLYQLESRIRQDFDFDTNSTYCKGKYDIRWFWDNMLQLSATWDQTKCTGQYAKWWDNELACFAKYCKFWNWYDLQCASISGSNPVTWEETYSVGGKFPKQWLFEANDTICKVPQEATFIDTVETSIQVYTATAVVKILDTPPVANLYCLTQPVTGVSPFTVQITPRGSIPSGFPIDKIIWTFGDGTPSKTVWRYKTPDPTFFTYTNTFSGDPSDPRNYDLIYTYKRNKDIYPVFYPSIEVYSGCTNTSDSCSITVGPISLSSTENQIHLLKSQNINYNNLYALQYNNNVTFVTTETSNSTFIPAPNIPKHLIKNTDFPIITQQGNSSDIFPVISYPQC